MNLSSRVVYFVAHEEFCCCLFMYRAFFAFCRKKDLWLFKKCWKKKRFGKKDVFLLVLLYIVYTNYYEY